MSNDESAIEKQDASLPPQFDKTHSEEELILLKEFIRIANREDMGLSHRIRFAIFDSRTYTAFVVYATWFLGTVYLAGPALMELTLWDVLPTFLFCDLLSGIFHIYLDHSKVQFDKDISTIDHARMGFQVHHMYPNFHWLMNPDYQPYLECNKVFPGANLVALINALTLKLPVIHCMCLFAVALQATHYYCHARTHNKDIPFLVRKLQDWGVILSPKRHQQHHTTYDSDFCILNGYTNWLIDWFIADEKRLIDWIEWLDDSPAWRALLVPSLIAVYMMLWKSVTVLCTMWTPSI